MSDRSTTRGRRAPRLLLVTPPDVLWGQAFCAALDGALDGGVDAVLVRMPASTAQEVWELARSVQPLVHAAGAQLLIHDRIDVARALDADGVHLARRSLPIADARAQLPGATIGFSAHAESEIVEAGAGGADYVTISPVFVTTSKPGVAPLGPERAQAWSRAASLPVLWLGGVQSERLWSRGARPRGGVHGVAAIDAFADATSAETEARRIRAWLDGESPPQ